MSRINVHFSRPIEDAVQEIKFSKVKAGDPFKTPDQWRVVQEEDLDKHQEILEQIEELKDQKQVEIDNLIQQKQMLCQIVEEMKEQAKVLENENQRLEKVLEEQERVQVDFQELERVRLEKEYLEQKVKQGEEEIVRLKEQIDRQADVFEEQYVERTQL